MDCELCDADRMTTWWYEDDVCWIADCESCGVPMVVWRVHGSEPSDRERMHMIARLREVADAREVVRIWIDERRRSIPDHFHAHARPRLPL